MTQDSFDVAIIGGGMAGAAVAAYAANHARVLVLEGESQPGYHATGRSAALFSEIYGNAPIRALSRASRAFLYQPPSDFCADALVTPRGVLYIARDDQCEALHAFGRLPDVAHHTRMLDAAEAMAFTPCLRPGYVNQAVYEPDARDIDVHALHHGFLRQLRAHGGQLLCHAQVSAMERDQGGWRIHTHAGEFRAAVVVNAAGAWVDRVAALAKVDPLGIQPLRRTAFMIDSPDDTHADGWPLTIDIDEQFYFKPDAGRLLLSPADETPSEPGDAWPEDLDVAIAAERIEQATTLSITHVRQKWAGLRSFVADRSPVVGYDPKAEGFFWLAALGGYGIQTAPAMGRLAAALLQRREIPADIEAAGLEQAAILPQRLRSSTGSTSTPACR